MLKQDVLPFFRTWLSKPLSVASITPSSSILADLITSEIAPDSAPVIEFGPGTGVFTRALLARGVPEERLTLIENDSTFAEMLRRRFPAATVLCMDAAHIVKLPIFEGERAGAVVSGLPLLSLPLRKGFAIMAGAFAHMRPDGAFYQFTYGPRCPIPQRILDRLDLEAVRIGGVFANIPPAAVYRIRRC